VRAPCGFDYAVLRVVPRVEREEFLNAGVVVWCLAQDYLAARVGLDVDRLKALDATADVEAIRAHLEAVPRICAGDPTAGPVARLSAKERFHWLVSPRSTVLQTSAVHSGRTEAPDLALERLFRILVERRGA
jgi:Protein of unknown function (DUF3037)